jgi:hypothetical protein
MGGNLMSHLTETDNQEKAYEAGYDEGYGHCKSEMSMKIKAILRFYLYSENVLAPTELVKQIGDVLDGI